MQSVTPPEGLQQPVWSTHRPAFVTSAHSWNSSIENLPVCAARHLSTRPENVMAGGTERVDGRNGSSRGVRWGPGEAKNATLDNATVWCHIVIVTTETRYSIGELAERAGVTRRTVRFYVQCGLIPSRSAAAGASTTRRTTWPPCCG